MPELPEVERARRELATLGDGCRIKSITTYEDSIVFNGVTTDEFKSRLIGKDVAAVKRKGKNFYVGPTFNLCP